MTAIRPQLTHAGIYVDDIAKMRDFYVRVIGLIETDHGHGTTFDNDFVFMSANPLIHHQLILATGRAERARMSTVNQLSFKVANLQELRVMRDRVKDYGITRIRPVSHANAWSIYFDDPEGNGVEIYLDTPFHASQPHADALDLDLSDEAIVRATEDAGRDDPTFTRIENWNDEMRAVLNRG
ncbi:MAG: VOC family protein [Stellaceae bacterium]